MARKLLRPAVGKLSKNKLVPATVLDIVGDLISVKLSANGRVLAGIPFVGGPPNKGDTVYVDYASGQPVAECRGRPPEIAAQKFKAPKEIRTDFPQYQINPAVLDIPDTTVQTLPQMGVSTLTFMFSEPRHMSRHIASESAEAGTNWSTYLIDNTINVDKSAFIVNNGYVFYFKYVDIEHVYAVKQNITTGVKTEVDFATDALQPNWFHYFFGPMVVVDDDTMIVVDWVEDDVPVGVYQYTQYYKVKKITFSTGTYQTLYTITLPAFSGLGYYLIDTNVAFTQYNGVNYLIIPTPVWENDEWWLSGIDFYIINLNTGTLAAKPNLALPFTELPPDDASNNTYIEFPGALPISHSSGAKVSIPIKLQYANWLEAGSGDVKLYTVDVSTLTAVEANYDGTTRYNLPDAFGIDLATNKLHFVAWTETNSTSEAHFVVPGDSPTIITHTGLTDYTIVGMVYGMAEAYYLIDDTTVKLMRASDRAIIFDTGRAYNSDTAICHYLDAESGRLWYYDRTANTIKGRWPGLPDIDISLDPTVQDLAATFTLDLVNWCFVLTGPSYKTWVVAPVSIPAEVPPAVSDTTGAIHWNDVYSKPSTFTPSAHQHLEVDITDIDHDAVKIQGADVPVPTAGDNGKALVYDNASGDFIYGNIGDATAIHDNVDGEINALTEKLTPAGGDMLIIEDSAASYAKKKLQVGNLTAGPGGSDGTAIHDDQASEISALTEKATPVGDDLILIEDSEATFVKKKIKVSSITSLDGHVIVDDGTPLAQRANLEFVGFSMSDDSVNDKTVINAPAGGGVGSYIQLTNRQTAGTYGGSNTTGAWTTVVINTEDADTGGDCALASNQFTLEAGTYRMRSMVNFYKVNNFKTRLQNITDGTTVATSLNGNSHNSDNTGQFSHIEHRFTIAAQKTFELQYHTQTFVNLAGLGQPYNAGVDEIYAIVVLEKE